MGRAVQGNDSLTFVILYTLLLAVERCFFLLVIQSLGRYFGEAQLFVGNFEINNLCFNGQDCIYLFISFAVYLCVL